MRIYEARLSYSLVSEGENTKIDRPDKVVDYLRSAFEENPVQEAFYAIYLDAKNHPIGRHRLTLGTATSVYVAPREVFRGAIIAGAATLLVAHNHPSGDPTPSAQDMEITKQLLGSSKILDIELLDHVIIGDERADPAGLGFFSFRQEGWPLAPKKSPGPYVDRPKIVQRGPDANVVMFPAAHFRARSPRVPASKINANAMTPHHPDNPSEPTLADVLHEIRAVRRDFAELRKIVAPLATRQLSRAQQAKKAGVHPSTLWRRECKARARLLLWDHK